MRRDNRRNLHSDIWRESVKEEVSEELAFHIEMRARELHKTGIPLEDARRLAAARFVKLKDVQAECEEIGVKREVEMKRNTFWSELQQDIHFAFRQMRAAPAFTLLVIATLALGIGASTTIFSAVNAVVLRPLGLPNEDRIFLVHEGWQGQESDVSAGSYTDWKSQGTLFSAMAAVDWDNYVIATGDSPERVLGAAVTSDYFKVFTAQPLLGRTFLPEDQAPGAPRVVVLSYGTYKTRFNADPSIVGKDLRLNGKPARVVGVTRENFDPMQYAEALWVPLTITAEQIAERGGRYLDVVALKKAGVSDESMRDQLDRIVKSEKSVYPQEYDKRTIMATPIRKGVIGDNAKPLFMLLGAVLVVLLIACANIANLLLARGASRQKELAVRGALGAAPGRILRQLLTENLVLALVTVAVSVGVAMLGTRLITQMPGSGIARLGDTRVDGNVLLFAILLGAVSSVIFGLAPAWRAVKTDLQTTLRSGGRDADGTIKDRLRSALVAAEVALSVLLLTTAGLLIRTSINASRVDPGFRVSGVVAARVTLPAQTYADPQRALGAFQAIVSTTSQRPGVASVAVSSLPPVAAGGNEMFLNPADRPQTQENATTARLRIISPGYFDVLAIPIKQGRAFNEHDVRSGELVAVISEDLAKKMWPGESPLGKRFACCEQGEHPRDKIVVGVTPSLHTRGPALPPDPEFYIPVAQAPGDSWDWIQRTMTVVATGKTSPETLIRAIRDGVTGVDPLVPVYRASTVSDAMNKTMEGAHFNTILLSILGMFGLVLAAIGIYGVVSYFVNLRTREIGLRMALGATTHSVVSLMIAQALVPVAVGFGIGAVGAFGAARLLRASLLDVSPADPVTFACVVAGLFVVALVAIIVPARRASRIAPSHALL